MRLLCLIPTAWLTDPVAPLPTVPYDCTPCTSDPTLTVMAADFGDRQAYEESWSHTPGVVLLPDIWDWHLPLPAAHPAARALGAKPGDTMGQLARALRATWPLFRH